MRLGREVWRKKSSFLPHPPVPKLRKHDLWIEGFLFAFDQAGYRRRNEASVSDSSGKKVRNVSLGL
jgi:hypothetical protein